MIIVKEYNDLRIPDYALSYLVNRDSSGLNEKDIKAIDQYMRDFYGMLEEGESLIFSVDDPESESYFTWSPEFGLACSVYDCTILIVK